MNDVSMALERNECVTIHVYDHGMSVHVWLDGEGLLHTSIGNGEVDSIQIESREKLLSIKSQKSEPLKDLLA